MLLLHVSQHFQKDEHLVSTIQNSSNSDISKSSEQSGNSEQELPVGFAALPKSTSKINDGNKMSTFNAKIMFGDLGNIVPDKICFKHVSAQIKKHFCCRNNVSQFANMFLL